MGKANKRGKKPPNLKPLKKQVYIDQLIAEVESRGLTASTLKEYLISLHSFLDFYSGESPENLGLLEIKKFQRDLLKNKGLAPSTVNRHMSGINFFYINVLEIHDFSDLLPRVKVPKKIPIVLSENEVARMVKAVNSALWRAVILTLYSSGLRQSEVRNLKVKDIDSDRMVLQIRNSKGQKSRQALLSPSTLKALRTYWKVHRADRSFKSDFLFIPSRECHFARNAKQLSPSAIGHIVKRTAELAGVKKKFTHTFCAIRLQLIF
jgi:site-specific recombinase XerD